MEHIDRLEAMGVEFECSSNDRMTVFKILVPWSAEEWMGVLHREGEYLPMCCGRISDARDALFEALREGGWIDTADLQKFSQLVGGHDGYADPTWRQSDHPVARLLRIWDVIKSHCRLDPYSDAREPDLSNPQDALDAVTALGLNLQWDLLFNNSLDHEAGRAWRQSLLGRFFPAVAALAEHVRKLEIEPVEGFGVFGPDGGLVRVVGGLAVFTEMEDVKSCLCSANCANPGRSDSLEVRRVRITADGGIEKLEPVETDMG